MILFLSIALLLALAFIYYQSRIIHSFELNEAHKRELKRLGVIIKDIEES